MTRRLFQFVAGQVQMITVHVNHTETHCTAVRTGENGKSLALQQKPISKQPLKSRSDEFNLHYLQLKRAIGQILHTAPLWF